MLAGFDVKSFRAVLTDNWELFPAMYGGGLGLNIWHRKNKMRYQNPGPVIDPDEL